MRLIFIFDIFKNKNHDVYLSSIHKKIDNQVVWILVANELISRTYMGNTGFDSQREQRLARAHASTHEPD